MSVTVSIWSWLKVSLLAGWSLLFLSLAGWVVGYGILSSSLIGVIVSPDVGDQQARDGGIGEHCGAVRIDGGVT
jgi:hypothetical protein